MSTVHYIARAQYVYKAAVYTARYFTLIVVSGA
jgi:hypothetical protein